MADRDVDALRQELRSIGEEMARADELLQRRGKAVDEARKARLTVREIALLLGMTEAGVRKAQNAFHRRQRYELGDGPSAMAS